MNILKRNSIYFLVIISLFLFFVVIRHIGSGVTRTRYAKWAIQVNISKHRLEKRKWNWHKINGHGYRCQTTTIMKQCAFSLFFPSIQVGFARYSWCFICSLFSVALDSYVVVAGVMCVFVYVCAVINYSKHFCKRRFLLYFFFLFWYFVFIVL